MVNRNVINNMPEQTIYANKFLENYTLEKCKDKAVGMMVIKLQEILRALEAFNTKILPTR